MSTDWFNIPIPPEYIGWIIKIIIATCLGALIGFERERLKRPAGLRTHILVTIGATLVTLANTQLALDMQGIATVNPARYGAAVISGIGFLGAGTIIKANGNIKGLTTAASIWGTACIGIVIGHGYYAMGIFSTVTVVIVLESFIRLEALFHRKNPQLYMDICIQNDEGVIGRIGDQLNAIRANIVTMSINSQKDGLNHLIIHIRHANNYTENQILELMSRISGVQSVKKTL